MEAEHEIDMHTYFVLYSGSSDSTISGGVRLRYFFNNDTFRVYVGLNINFWPIGSDRMVSRKVKNYTVTLTPYCWYKLSLIVDSVSEQVQLYLDNELAAQLFLDKKLFETFNEISVWGWIP